MHTAKAFLVDETAAVTVDFVVLTAGIVGIAVVFMAPISVALGSASVFIAEQIGRYWALMQ